MDVCKPEQELLQKQRSRTTRQPLVPAENKNGAAAANRTRQVSSRYRSPTPTAPKRSQSPTTTSSVPKRAISAERKRGPSRPSSPSSPTTPIQDTNAELLLASRKIVGNKLPESLWPSTMRSLSVSFQSDTISIPVSKREKPVSHTPADRERLVLRPSSSNLAGLRKPTPERKRSPLKGNNSNSNSNSLDQSENSKPVESSHSRLVDQHRWPRLSTSLNRSVDLSDRTRCTDSGAPALRRLSLEGRSKPLLKSSSDLLMQISRDDSSSSSSSDRTQLANAAARALSLPTPGVRAPSPTVSRGLSPSRSKVVNSSSRGPSPARGRALSPSRQPQSSNSVLSFIADIKKGKKAASHIEDVHQLRLLYNRHLQWRYANARSNAALQFQKVKAERIVYSVSRTIADLWDSIMGKRIDLQQLRLKLKLYSILNNQLTCLDEWASIERDHVNSLTSAAQDLQASTIRIPVTGGARGDIESVKAAVCSALDVMHSMGSSLCSILSRVEGMNSLVSELANVAAQERGMLDECESVLGSTTALQVEEYSLRTHVLQMKQGWTNEEPSVCGY